MNRLIFSVLLLIISSNCFSQEKVKLEQRPNKSFENILDWYVVNNQIKTVFVVCLKKKTDCSGKVSTMQKEIELRPSKSYFLGYNRFPCMDNNVETVEYTIESVRFKEE